MAELLRCPCGVLGCPHLLDGAHVTAAKMPDPPTPFCFAPADHETLALITQHRLGLRPIWKLSPETQGFIAFSDHGEAFAPTIGDAVRACVARIQNAGDGPGTE